ncbi:MAG: hypothetical protein KGI38_02355 [Thaumarchaeota archaeon]|nr:hypothetical protein [Nitrososphaerota archaeon]
MSKAGAASDGQQGPSSSALIGVTIAIEALVVVILWLQVSGAIANVNTTTATLLVIMVLVAMIPFASSINFPGGGGFTLRNTSGAATLVRQVVGDSAVPKSVLPSGPRPAKKLKISDLKAGKTMLLPRAPYHADLVIKASDTDFEIQSTPRTSPPQWKALIGSNPVMGIAAMRYDIEEHLRSLASSHSVPLGAATGDIRYLVRSLGSAGILTPKEQEAILTVTDLTNQAVHARRVDTAAAEQLSSMGDDILTLLGIKNDQS